MFLRQTLMIFRIFLLFFLITPALASAKFDIITVRTNPETPGPNQPVTVSVESYAIPINSAKITWYVDGKGVKEGIAEKSLLTKTKDFGEKVTIDIVIVTQDGSRYDKTLILKPEEIDLLWEANTYTPPFYKGKALPTYKSTIKVTAIPRFNDAVSDPSEYYYTWKVNRSQGVGEGLGKNFAIVQAGWSGGLVPVNVEVSKPKTGEKGVALQQIPVVDPIVRFYEQAPLLGVNFNRTLPPSTAVKGAGLKIRAIPYFFSLENYGTDDLVYSWQSGSTPIIGALNPNVLSLSSTGRAGGASSISLTVQNRKRILQTADTKVIVNFNEQ